MKDSVTLLWIPIHKRLLNDSIIHATIVRQEEPKNDDTSIYHIFERLNNSGRKLTAQQIRVAIYHGQFIDLIKELNEVPKWRGIYGKHSTALKDQELILRFLALFFRSSAYSRPMAEFLNKFTMWGRRSEAVTLHEWASIFRGTISVVYDVIGPRAFRPERALNAAVFDSVMVGLTRRLQKPDAIDPERLRDAYSGLLKNTEYLRLVSQSTSDEANVSDRIKAATQAFAEI